MTRFPIGAPYSQQRIYYLDYPCELALYAVRNNIGQITEPMLGLVPRALQLHLPQVPLKNY